MQVGQTGSRAVMTLFHRGINMSNQNIKMFSLGLRKMATSPSKSLVNSSGSRPSVVTQMGRASTGRQLLLRSELSSQQIGGRWLCDKTNRVVEVDGKTSKTPEKVQQVASNQQHEHFSARAPSGFDKRLLVSFGKFKSAEEVPDLVSVHLLNATRNKFRVYVNMFIAFLTMFGCGVMIYRGHQRAGTGETIADHNMRRHPQHYKQPEQKD
ncbi:uncharacterized protein LOC115918928 [Strongylocentrotus purpuratus]|uniref:Uncharacterized protein n=1 Tax=Strongylocentrotus purpuratus TaxID=7668 RepID=A0A7M7PFJ2_STRPU|nr:uncharacterized protein LOC115918928 [Strongylocentrotus purpuratus]